MPKTLEEWTVEKINQIIKYPGIESESLDFKKEPNCLHEHFCAMSNTNGGFLILGIVEDKSNDGTTLLGYHVRPFSKGKEESINQQIRNAISLLEHTPSIRFNHLPIDEGFITVIEIKNEISKKPFMIKNTGQFWVRIKDSTQIANRSTIQILFSSSINQRNSIERLKSATSLLKESFLHTLNDIHGGFQYIPEIDLELIKNAVSDSEWFLTESGLWGMHTNQGGHQTGINSIFHDLAILNSKIRAFNQSTNQSFRDDFITNLRISYNRGGSYHNSILEFLDKITSISNKFLKNVEQ